MIVSIHKDDILLYRMFIQVCVLSVVWWWIFSGNGGGGGSFWFYIVIVMYGAGGNTTYTLIESQIPLPPPNLYYVYVRHIVQSDTQSLCTETPTNQSINQLITFLISLLFSNHILTMYSTHSLWYGNSSVIPFHFCPFHSIHARVRAIAVRFHVFIGTGAALVIHTYFKPYPSHEVHGERTL